MNSDNSKSLIDKIFKVLQTIVQKITSQIFLVLIAFIVLLILANIVAPTLTKEWGMYFWLSLFILTLFFDLLANFIIRYFKDASNSNKTKSSLKETPENTPIHLPANTENWEEKYLQRIYDESRFVALGGIESKISDPRQRSVELKSIYVDLLSTDMIDDTSSSYLRDPISASILSLVDKHKKLVILGGPGSGKSTFAKFTTLCLSASRLYKDSEDDWLRVLRSEDCKWSHGPLIPVRISLGEFPIAEISSQLTNKDKFDLIFSLLSLTLEHSELKGFAQELTEYF